MGSLKSFDGGDVRRTFLRGVAEKLGFYVYLLIDPRDGRIFYIGKGVGGRCFAHLHEARMTTADSRGEYPKLATIRAIESQGLDVRIDLLRHGPDEATAYTVECAALDLLAMDAVDNRVTGHCHDHVGRMSVADVNARYAATPVRIHPEHRVLLIRVSREFKRGMSDQEVYEATRGWWVASRHRTAQVEWVFAVYAGVVRAVYHVEGWEVSRDGKRIAFQGCPDAVMESPYLGTDVSSYATFGGQNPLRYVNC